MFEEMKFVHASKINQDETLKPMQSTTVPKIHIERSRLYKWMLLMFTNEKKNRKLSIKEERDIWLKLSVKLDKNKDNEKVSAKKDDLEIFLIWFFSLTPSLNSNDIDNNIKLEDIEEVDDIKDDPNSLTNKDNDIEDRTAKTSAKYQSSLALILNLLIFIDTIEHTTEALKDSN